MRNALQHTPAKAAITIAAEPYAQGCRFTIADNGKGWPKENRNRLLEPYVTTREKGTGLGLAIVNKIVDEHGGDMSFASPPSGGTRVTLRFARNPNPIEGGPL